VNYDALVKAHSKAIDNSDKEHVTPYIYNHPQEFSIRLEDTPPKILDEQNIRLTVDTGTDFQNAAEILKQLVEKDDFSYTFEDVLLVVKNMNGLKESMTQQIKLNSKS
jgi:spore coat polysaccharide biosynthesis protein SpsF